MKVLYADSDPEVRDYVSMLLEAGLDCEILEASSGNEALSVLAFDADVDFIITEVQMKGGGGHLIVDYLDENKMAIPIVWLSDSEFEQTTIVQEVLARSPLNAFVPKPFRDDQFFPVIDRILALKEEMGLNGSGGIANSSENVADANEKEEEVDFDFEELGEFENPSNDSNEVSPSNLKESSKKEAEEKNSGADDDWSYGFKKKEAQEVGADWSVGGDKKNPHGEESADWSLKGESKEHGEEGADWSLKGESKEHGEESADWSLKGESKEHGEEGADWSLKGEGKEHDEEAADWDLKNKGEGSEEGADWDLKNKGEGSEEDADWDLKNKGEGSEEAADWDLKNKGEGSEEDADWNLKKETTESSWDDIRKKQNEEKAKNKNNDSDDLQIEDMPYDTERFKRVKIKRFYNLSLSKVDVYIRLNEKKYLKLLNSDESYDQSRIEKYENKGQKYLFIEKESYQLFQEQFADLVTQKLEKAKKMSGDIKAVADLAAFNFAQDIAKEFGVTPFTASKVKESVQASLDTLEKLPSLQDLLKRIMRGGDYISEHSLLLSYFAGQICLATSWGNNKTLEKLSMAALLHDISLPKNNLAKIHALKQAKELNLSESDIEIVKKHPGQSAKLVSEGENIFADVDTIILQHHELPDQSGFPRGLGALSISPLSCIFILASELTERVYGKPADAINMDEIKKELQENFNKGNFKKPLEALLKVF